MNPIGIRTSHDEVHDPLDDILAAEAQCTQRHIISYASEQLLCTFIITLLVCGTHTRFARLDRDPAGAVVTKTFRLSRGSTFSRRILLEV